MAKSVKVPRFGNWEGEADIPYTACFDKAFKGHSKEEPIRPGSHQNNAEKRCYNGSSPSQPDPHSEKEKPTEKVAVMPPLDYWPTEKKDLEVPKFGDWDGQGGDIPYTIYFERVRKSGSRGKTTSENDGHHNLSTGDARRSARRELVEEKSPGYQKGQKSGVIVRADSSKQRSKSGLLENSAVSVKENKKMLIERSPDSKQCQIHIGAVNKGHPVSDRRSLGQSKFGNSSESRSRTRTSRNEEVVPVTAFPKFGRWHETDSSLSELSQISQVLKHGKEATQSASGNDSFKHNSQTKIKKQKAKTCCFPWG